MQMTSPRSGERADADVAGAQDGGSSPSAHRAESQDDGSSSSGSYRSPTVTPPESPRAKSARKEMEDDPNYTPVNDEVCCKQCFYSIVRPRDRACIDIPDYFNGQAFLADILGTMEGIEYGIEAEEEVVPQGLAPETTSTEASNKRKRSTSGLKRGERGKNRFPDETFIITELGPKGQPHQPVAARKKFRIAVGFCVRDILDITWQTWKLVPASKKEECWKKLLTRFVFQDKSQEQLAMKYAYQQLAISFRNWKSDLARDYLQTGKDPTKKFIGKISAAQWERFREQRSTEDAVEKSKAASARAKKNIYPHHLGTGGYEGKMEVWQREDAAKRAKNIPVLSDELALRPCNWLRARDVSETETGQLVCEDEEVGEVQKR
jgi:hypothetical protein